MTQTTLIPSALDRLPQELWDYIIDLVAGIAHAYLLDCSLVCKRWYPRCRLHLLQSVKLRDEETAKALAELARTHTHFQVVARVTVYGSGVGDFRGPITHLLAVAKLLFPVLPCLVDLALRDAEWDVSDGPHVDAAFYGYLRSSSSIKRLHLDNVVITSNVVFARFVQALPYCEQVTFLNSRLGPNGMLFKQVALDMMSLRGIFGELSDRWSHSGRTIEENGASLAPGHNAQNEERLGDAIETHAATSHTRIDPKEPFPQVSNTVATDSNLGDTTRSTQRYIDSEECQQLVDTLMTIDIPLGDIRHLSRGGPHTLSVVRAAMSSRTGIQVIKDFAEAGFHKTVVNLLDAVLESVSATPQSRLYTTVFHTLRKICVKYGDAPDSLILPHGSIVLHSDRRPQERGGFADIYIGRWMNRVVGVKTFRISEREAIDATIKEITKEATLWRRLDHPNITPFYGLDKDHFDLSIICQWMPNGHVIRFLDNNPNASRPQLILDVARGLEYLHSEHVGIIHGDLKGGNILVDEHHRACLSDFGLSAVMYDCHTVNTSTQMSNFSSSLRWMAPEIHDPEAFGLISAVPTCEGDVYSFAMVMWEVFTGKVPFADARPDGKVIRIIMNGTRPARPAEAICLGLSDRIWSSMEECWAPNPSTRPTISQAITSLEAEWCSDASSDHPERVS